MMCIETCLVQASLGSISGSVQFILLHSNQFGEYAEKLQVACGCDIVMSGEFVEEAGGILDDGLMDLLTHGHLSRKHMHPTA